MTSNRNQEITVKILKIVGMGVLFAVISVLAPRFPYQALKAYLKHLYRQKYSHQQIRNSVAYLKRKKFVAYENKHFFVTRLGKKYLKRKAISDLSIPKVAWDSKWRVVTFDIPQAQVGDRHILRKKLKQLGFFHFQRSVFVIPYPCEQQIEQLTEELNVSEHVHVLLADRFKNDKPIAKQFKL